MNSRLATAAGTSGVLGGWLAIMPASTLTLSLRLSEWDPSGSGSIYSITLAAGWLTLIAALFAAGLWGDREEQRTGSRILLVRIAIPVLAAGGCLLALAPNPPVLIAAWMVLQVPVGVVVTSALTIVGIDARQEERRFASGLIGAAPIVALLLGSLSVRILETNLSVALLIPVVAGALLSLPLLNPNLHHSTEPDALIPSDKATKHSELARPVVSRNAMRAWIAFLVAVFLLSWATSTANGFVVVFVRESLMINVGETAANAVLLASVLALTASLATGVIGHGSLRALRLWSVAASLCSVALALIVLWPEYWGILLGAAVFGIAFGLANGTEFAVVLAIRGRTAHLGRDLGAFTSVTTVPYVLVPAVATVWLSRPSFAGTSGLFVVAALAALAALAFVLLTLTHMKRVSEGSRHTPAPPQ